MTPSVFLVHDNVHSELSPEFDSWNTAMEEVCRLAAIPWNEKPNRAPCREWRECGRVYAITEYADDAVPREFVRNTPIAMLSAAGVRWFAVDEDAEAIAERSGVWAFHRNAIPHVLELARAHAARKRHMTMPDTE